MLWKLILLQWLKHVRDALQDTANLLIPALSFVKVLQNCEGNQSNANRGARQEEKIKQRVEQHPQVWTTIFILILQKLEDSSAKKQDTAHNSLDFHSGSILTITSQGVGFGRLRNRRFDPTAH
jgi:hypothetical protein